MARLPEVLIRIIEPLLNRVYKLDGAILLSGAAIVMFPSQFLLPLLDSLDTLSEFLGRLSILNDLIPMDEPP
jgi:hypothetical protein